VFFVHVQKTAGGTFRRHVQAMFEPGALFPEGEFEPDPMRAYWHVAELRTITPERRAAIRMYCGHYPFAATDVVPDDPLRLSLLREPVERTISYLRMASREARHAGKRLEEIYDDGFANPFFIRDHQAKVFAMTLDDPLESIMDVVDVDDRRLAVALDNLDRLDALGMADHLDAFLDDVHHVTGWTFTAVPDVHISRGELRVSPALRRRIAVENAADVAFYDEARVRWERRRAAPRVIG
jgi:hypothetical protein